MAANVAQPPGHPRYEQYRFVEEDLEDLSEEIGSAVETALKCNINISRRPRTKRLADIGDPAVFYIRTDPEYGDLDQFGYWLDDLNI